jgi:hypothetical protein
LSLKAGAKVQFFFNLTSFFKNKFYFFSKPKRMFLPARFLRGTKIKTLSRSPKFLFNKNQYNKELSVFRVQKYTAFPHIQVFLKPFCKVFYKTLERWNLQGKVFFRRRGICVRDYSGILFIAYKELPRLQSGREREKDTAESPAAPKCNGGGDTPKINRNE